MFHQKLGFALFLFAVFFKAPLASAQEYRESFVCDPETLTAVVADLPGHGFGLDLDRAKSELSAAMVQREYDIPNSNARVSFQLRYFPAGEGKPARVELAKHFFKHEGKTLALLLVFASPMSIDLDMPPGTTWLLKTDGDESLPGFDVACRYKRTRVSADCPSCK